MPVPVNREFQKDAPTLDTIAYFNPDAGSVVSHEGLRQMMAGENAMWFLQEAVEDFVADAAPSVMYEIGLEWGKRRHAINQHLLNEYVAADLRIEDLPLDEYVAWCNRLMKNAGWGRIEVREEDGAPVIHLDGPAYVETARSTGRPAGHLYAGFFAGLFGQAAGMDLGCIEIEGDGERLRFTVGLTERLDPVTFWNDSGATCRHIGEAMTQSAGTPARVRGKL